MDDGAPVAFRRGVRIALDYGQARHGVAKSDPDGLLATPVGNVTADDEAPAAIGRLIAELGAVEVFVGLPLTLAGHEGPSSQKAREFAGKIADITDIPVYLIDERHSTTQAARQLHQAGRSAKSQKTRIDAAAATLVLQAALDAARAGRVWNDRVAGLSSRD